MDVQPQCPGEPYTITTLICRGRQAKAYEKCPGCPHRERVNAMPLTAIAAPAPFAAPAPRGDFGRELEAVERAKPKPRLEGVKAAVGLGVAGGTALFHRGGGEGLLALARRIYHYF